MKLGRRTFERAAHSNGRPIRTGGPVFVPRGINDFNLVGPAIASHACSLAQYGQRSVCAIKTAATVKASNRHDVRARRPVSRRSERFGWRKSLLDRNGNSPGFVGADGLSPYNAVRFKSPGARPQTRHNSTSTSSRAFCPARHGRDESQRRGPMRAAESASDCNAPLAARPSATRLCTNCSFSITGGTITSGTTSSNPMLRLISLSATPNS